MATQLRTKVDSSEGRTFVELSGTINELSQVVLDKALSNLEPLVVISFRGVKRINSYGVKLLLEILARVSLEHRVEFVECSETITDQFLMVDFGRYARFKSLVLAYDCAQCGAEQRKLVHVDRDLRRDANRRIIAPTYPCACGGSLVTDDSLDFLADQLDA